MKREEDGQKEREIKEERNIESKTERTRKIKT